jgi:hypothetical protein
MREGNEHNKDRRVCSLVHSPRGTDYLPLPLPLPGTTWKTTQHAPLRPQVTFNATNAGQGQPLANDAANDMPPTAGPTDLTSTPYYRCEQLLAGWIRGAGAQGRLGDRG